MARVLPQSPQKKRSPANTLILDFCPPELQDDTSVPCEATKLVVICYSSPGKRMLSPSACTHPLSPWQASQTLLGDPLPSKGLPFSYTHIMRKLYFLASKPSQGGSVMGSLCAEAEAPRCSRRGESCPRLPGRPAPIQCPSRAALRCPPGHTASSEQVPSVEFS